MESILNSVLVDFSMLFDTDIGVATYLYLNSSNKSFYEDFMKYATYDFYRFKALTRTDENPIRYLFKDEYKDSADDIYQDIKNTKWNKVLEYSPMTDILTALSIAASQSGIIVQVNCRNEEEQRKLKKVNKWDSYINLKDTSKYCTIYLHDIREAVDINIEGKVVYLYDYALNYLRGDMVEKTISELAVPFSYSSQFKFISPFKDFQLPEGYEGSLSRMKERKKMNSK